MPISLPRPRGGGHRGKKYVPVVQFELRSTLAKEILGVMVIGPGSQEPGNPRMRETA